MSAFARDLEQEGATADVSKERQAALEQTEIDAAASAYSQAFQRV